MYPFFPLYRTVGFLDNIDGAVFGLQVSLCQVLPQNTDGEQLQSADEEDDAHHGRVAGHRIAKD